MPSYITATASVTYVDLVIGYIASSNGTQCEIGVRRRLFVETSGICPEFHFFLYVVRAGLIQLRPPTRALRRPNS